MTEPAPPPAIDVAGLRGAGVQVEGLQVPRGSVTALVGPSGAGKTTLLRLLLGIERCGRGDAAAVVGLSPRRDALAIRAQTGYVPERVVFPPNLDARALGRLVRPFYPRWDAKRYLELLAFLGVAPRVRAEDLPAATRVRLALALSLAFDPSLLLVDVPHDLDALGRKDLLLGVEETRNLRRDEGRTVVVATPHPHEVERLADRVVVLARGRVAWQGERALLRSAVRRLAVQGADGPPQLPPALRPLCWRPRAGGRPSDLWVIADAAAGGAASPLEGLPAGVTSCGDLDLEEAVHALTAGAVPSP